MTREQAINLIRELRAGLEPMYGERLKGVYLFGSYARGEENEDSDIDVAVILQGPVNRWEERRRTNQLLSDLSLREDCLLTAVFLSEEDLQTTPYAIHRRILREGVPV